MVKTLTGRDTLGHLNSTLQIARGDLQQLERGLQGTSDAIARNRIAQNAVLKDLAALRLDVLTSGEIHKDLDSADHRVQKLLRERESAAQDLENRAGIKESQLDELEKRRDELHNTVDEKAGILAEREASVQSTLSDDPEFQQQLAATRAADAVAVHASDKAALARSDRNDKGAPYDGNELFSYLWKRGYGTSKYKAGPLTRFLDAWVARLCDYEDARQNYWMLLEIPKRLEAHAEHVSDAAEAELANLQALERDAAAAGGVLQAADELEEAERVQDEIDQQISGCEDELHELRASLGRFAVAEDEYSEQCLRLLSEAMGRRDVMQLMRQAGSTFTLEDDAQVEGLQQLRREEDQLQSELQQHRALLRDQQKRQRELEGVRKRFKQNRFDDLRSSFDKGDLLVMMMRQVLGGVLQGGDLWDAIRRQQKYRDVGGAWPDFGSGGVVRRRPARTRTKTRRKTRTKTQRPTWHWPGRRGGSRKGGFRLPPIPRRSNSSSRGGFKTGGSF